MEGKRRLKAVTARLKPDKRQRKRVDKQRKVKKKNRKNVQWIEVIDIYGESNLTVTEKNLSHQRRKHLASTTLF